MRDRGSEHRVLPSSYRVEYNYASDIVFIVVGILAAAAIVSGVPPRHAPGQGLIPLTRCARFCA